MSANKIITVIGGKGGVGKTTTVSAFANGLALKGHKVLCVDLDPQPGNLSLALDGDKDDVMGSYEVFALRPGFQRPEDFVQETFLCDLIAANHELIHIEGLLAGAEDRATRLKSVLDPLRSSYSYILIDTPPTFGILSLNALMASDEAVIATHADYFSKEGMGGILKNITEVSLDKNPGLAVAGILVTQYRSNTKEQSDKCAGIDAFAKVAGVPVFKTRIRQSVKVQEAASSRTGLLDMRPRPACALDYEAVIGEYLARGKGR